ncbi:GFA family protein [Sphingomicrobium arenosum]|uniref:GFA family protein n=1 Tax=Sphingomicrobium arenosum TaxID=2233861 RepID=UPI00223E963C|nr:GFA family protein [Sphingomicrobium arenosum]
MSDPKGETLHGHCLCGAVTIEARPNNEHLDACHCDMCRRWGGIAYVGVNCAADTRFGGEEHLRRYRSSDWAERGFCGQCGSHLFYRFLPTGSYGMPAGLFDEIGGRVLAEEIFIDEKPDYYAFAGERPRKTGAQAIAEAKAAGFDLP